MVKFRQPILPGDVGPDVVAVRSRSGGFVYIDEWVMRVLVHLIESGHTIWGRRQRPPSAAFYGPKTMREHCNHIHVGY